MAHNPSTLLSPEQNRTIIDLIGKDAEVSGLKKLTDFQEKNLIKKKI